MILVSTTVALVLLGQIGHRAFVSLLTSRADGNDIVSYLAQTHRVSLNGSSPTFDLQLAREVPPPRFRASAASASVNSMMIRATGSGAALSRCKARPCAKAI